MMTHQNKHDGSKRKKKQTIAFDSLKNKYYSSSSGKIKEYCGWLYIKCRKQDILNLEHPISS